MYKITVGNIRSQITPKLDPEHFDLVEAVTSYAIPDAWRTERYKRGWDGRIRLFKKLHQFFPAGYLHRIITVFENAGINFELVDDRPDPCPEPYCWDDFLPFEDGTPWETREYQDRAVYRGFVDKRGIISVATGGGKTGIFGMLWRALGEPLGAIFVHRRTLLNQHASFLEDRLGVEIGKIGDGLWEPQQLTIALIDSIYPPPRLKKGETHKPATLKRWAKAKDWLHTLKFFFSDECHLIGDNNWNKILMECPAYYRFGCSGTPFGRGSVAKHLLVAATGPIIVDISFAELRRLGYVCPVDIMTVNFGEHSVKCEDWEYKDAYRYLLVDDEERYKFIVKLLNKYGQNRKCLVLVGRIAQGNNLKAFCKDVGWTVSFIAGSTSTPDREKALRSLSDESLDVVIASAKIVEEGLDVPDLSLIVNAAGGKQEAKAIQRVGRGVRNSKGKDDLLYIDIFDCGNSYLRAHNEDRLAAYLAEPGYTVKQVSSEDLP